MASLIPPPGHWAALVCKQLMGWYMCSLLTWRNHKVGSFMCLSYHLSPTQQTQSTQGHSRLYFFQLSLHAILDTKRLLLEFFSPWWWDMKTTQYMSMMAKPHRFYHTWFVAMVLLNCTQEDGISKNEYLYPQQLGVHFFRFHDWLLYRSIFQVLKQSVANKEIS